MDEDVSAELEFVRARMRNRELVRINPRPAEEPNENADRSPLEI
jgi:hypothetical protein